jgi:hypothetical protein
MRRLNWKTLAAVATGLVGALGAAPAHAQDTVVDRIPLRYIDARYVTLILGGTVLPTEADIVMGRPGYGGGSMNRFNGGGSMNGFNTGGYGGGFMPGNGIYGDPATNSILLFGGNGGVGNGSALYGDPGSNSLLIGPRGRAQGTRNHTRSRAYGAPGTNYRR